MASTRKRARRPSAPSPRRGRGTRKAAAAGTRKAPTRPAAPHAVDRVRLLVRDPEWIFAYWDVDPAGLKDLGRSLGERGLALSRLTLRVLDPVSGGSSDILLPPGARWWYIRTDSVRRTYRAELGVTLPSSEFRRLAESNTVVTPRVRRSAGGGAMRRSSICIGLALVLGSCGREVRVPTAPVVTRVAPSETASTVDELGVAAASRPEKVTWTDVLEDVDPCSEVLQRITIAWACLLHEKDGGEVLACQRTITTTPTGYVGRGTYSTVNNEHVIAWRITDILKNDAGNRVKMQYRSVYDPSTGTGRVEDSSLTCLRR